MYQFLYQRFGSRVANSAFVAWYAILLLLVLIFITGPAGNFRYDNL